MDITHNSGEDTSLGRQTALYFSQSEVWFDTPRPCAPSHGGSQKTMSQPQGAVTQLMKHDKHYSIQRISPYSDT